MNFEEEIKKNFPELDWLNLQSLGSGFGIDGENGRGCIVAITETGILTIIVNAETTPSQYENFYNNKTVVRMREKIKILKNFQ